MKKSIIMVVITACIVLSYFYPHAMLNPGELLEDHQQLNDKCLSCHAVFVGISNEKCLTCHKLSEIDKKNSEETDTAVGKILSFHLHLSKQKCSSCHTDHQGSAYVMDKAFQHQMLTPDVLRNCANCHGKPADNLHKSLTVSCSSCHNTSGWKLTGAFNHDLITGVDKSNCTFCHRPPQDDFHRNLTTGCDQCHTTEKWVPSTFDHSRYFFLDKDHNASCKTCHTQGTFLTYTCYGCHEHTESRMKSKHYEEGIYDITSCASCHKSADEHDIKRGGEFNQSERNNVREYIRKQEQKVRDHRDDD